MKTYYQIHFSRISEILMQAALGVSAVCGYKHVSPDMQDCERKSKQVPTLLLHEG